jgi:sugar O-acyltransferase (sialic acid O-acetyltransferase NeuD family)
MYIYGASGHGAVIAEIAEELGLDLKGFVDDNSTILSFLEYPVIGISTLAANCDLIIGIGNNKIRKKLVDSLGERNFAKIFHPASVRSKRTEIGLGTVIMAGCTVNTSVTIGKHCILNTNSSIDHDCKIGDFVHISPNSALAGNVEVNDGAHIGIGATVIQGVKIGKWSVVGAGAVVIENVPDYATVVGIPAKIIKIENA